jgi:hypothetical protein
MRATTFIGTFLAAAAGLIVFWNLRPDSDFSAQEIAVDHPTATRSEPIELTTEVAQESVDSGSDRLEQSAAEEADDSRLARRQQDIVEAIYRTVGGRVVQKLTDSGIAPSDSEEIARRYAADSAECAMDALQAEAARQSISVDELLARIAAAVADGGDINDVFDVVDRSSVETSTLLCEADALQRAGIPLQSDVQMSGEEIERFRECVGTFNNSDITDRNISLESCAQSVLGVRPTP